MYLGSTLGKSITTVIPGQGLGNISVIFLFFLCVGEVCAVCGILVPWPGVEPRPLQWKRRVLTAGPPGKSPHISNFKMSQISTLTTQIWQNLRTENPWGSLSLVDDSFTRGLEWNPLLRCNPEKSPFVYMELGIPDWGLRTPPSVIWGTSVEPYESSECSLQLRVFPG